MKNNKTCYNSWLLFLSVGYYCLILITVTEAACSSCLISPIISAGGTAASASVRNMNHHVHRHPLAAKTSSYRRTIAGGSGRPASPWNLRSTTRSALVYIAWSQLSTHFGCNVLSSLTSSQHQYPQYYNHQQYYKHQEETDKDNNDDVQDEQKSEKSLSAPSKNVSAGMVGAIGIYKNFISPLLPPACRFLPTCSQYGVQAIEEFGPSKGALLTAWRLMRCSPFGGRGYDPPKWPPVFYTYGSY